MSRIYESGGARRTAVHELTLEIADGELLVLVGPSGCGKSTTLRMIAGLEPLSTGRLWIGDRMMNDVAPKDRDIAMVFQNYALYPHMTVEQNLAFALRLRNLPRVEIAARVRETAAILGIEPLLGRRPRQLSGGERQRVALGRAIVRKPQVFLFDEPLSNLDAKLRVQMRREIGRLHQRLGTTMVYVTHDQVEAMTLGQRIAVLRDGRVQQLQTAQEVYRRPANLFVAGFIGSPPMSIVRGTAVEDGTRFAAGDSGPHLTVPATWTRALRAGGARPVLLGVRAEDVHIVPEDAPGAMPGVVELIEPLGGGVLTFLRIGACEITAQVPSGVPLPPAGGAVAVRFDPVRLHFFDAATEARLAED